MIPSDDPYRPLCEEFPDILGSLRWIDCQPGWIPLIRELCQGLEAINRRRASLGQPLLGAVQVKEKFGGLRFYMNVYCEEAKAIIREAEARSFVTCERCGQAGQIGNDQGWIRVLCPQDAPKGFAQLPDWIHTDFREHSQDR